MLIEHLYGSLVMGYGEWHPPPPIPRPWEEEEGDEDV